MRCGIARQQLERVERNRLVPHEVQEEGEDAEVAAAVVEELVVVADVAALQPMIRLDREV